MDKNQAGKSQAVLRSFFSDSGRKPEDMRYLYECKLKCYKNESLEVHRHPEETTSAYLVV